MIDITRISALIDALRNETQKEAITPEVLGALLQFLAELVNGCACDTDFLPVRNGLGDLKSAYRELAEKVITVEESSTRANTKADNAVVTDIAVVCGEHHVEARLKQKGYARVVADLPAATATTAGVMTTEHVDQLASAVADISKLKYNNVGGRGFIYVDIEHGDYLRILGAEDYLNKDYVPFLFRYSTKANRYSPKGLPGCTHEPSRKGWHPMGTVGTTVVNAESKIVSVNQEVYGRGGKGLSSAPQDFMLYIFGDYVVYYGKRRVKLMKWKNNVEVYRRVRLQYGIAFIHRKNIEGNKRLDLSRLATNIAPFHINWDINKSDGGWHWMFNK
ncbi:MAG: hypothetical protein Q4B68_10640 [Bacteroidales bacterium]|nr:hypothetical protein [Bacteroidales bacterium]